MMLRPERPVPFAPPARRFRLPDAHLIHAGTAGEVPARYAIPGAGVTLHVHAVDITPDLKAVEAQVEGMATHLLPRHNIEPARSA
ncbi:hypothetical protein [Aquipuribacter hungaricus]|uniref:Uncharacterized protein n=1 Tax=Aquipuribacter hungaricus TaxID=545624 RepID=A0ABV7WFG6_9MICO